MESILTGKQVMRFAAFLFAILLSSAPAWAFDCSNVTLPSSIVICSDPGLMKLADERQTALNWARWGLSPQLDRQLLADQRAWIRSYATACGVPPDRPPPNPVPASVQECFRRAGEARVAYLRNYGVAGTTISSSPSPALAQAPTDRIGPSFDCGNSLHPLALLICADPVLSRLDLRFAQAYLALFQQAGPEGQHQLKQEDIDFIGQVQQQCGLPQSGGLTPEIWRARNCIKAGYEQKRESWIARLTGPAYQQAVRSPELSIALQARLQKLGFLPMTAKIDGVYGKATQAAILAWQGVKGRAETGFLSDADAAALMGTAAPMAESTAPPLPPKGPEQHVSQEEGGETAAALATVIGSDEELWDLAVKRHKLLDEAKSHLGPEQQRDLLSDENRWFASYGKSCGIVPGTGVTIPLTAEIRDCLVRAGRARVAYLRAYAGQSAIVSPTPLKGVNQVGVPASLPKAAPSSQRSVNEPHSEAANQQAEKIPVEESDLGSWSGNGSRTTQPFESPGPYMITWQSSDYILIDVMKTDGDAEEMASSKGGHGQTYIPEGGTFYLDIAGSGSWAIKAVPVKSQTAPALPPANASGAAITKVPVTQINTQTGPAQIDKEKALIDIVDQAREKYQEAENDMARGGVRAWRKDAICQALPTFRVENWKGKIYNLSSNSDGKGVVTITIGPDIYVETYNNALSDIANHTLIDPESEVFKELSSMKEGDEVIFSGTFIPSNVDCIEEMSLTQEGSIAEPEFLFRFSSISAP